MSSATTLLFSPHDGLRAYAANVGHAARELLAALLAVRPALTDQHAALERARRQGRREMYRLARQCEAFSPNLSSELRFFAGRD